MAMKLSMTGQMRMEQRMKLAPRMIQSMEILQLPLLALQERIEAELNSNPVLETADQPEQADSETAESAAASQTSADEKEMVIGDDNDHIEDFQRLENFGEDFDEYLNNGGPIHPQPSGSGDPDKKMEALLNTAAQEQSLNDWLKDQWRLMDVDEKVRAAGELIIDYLDEKGYLTVRLEQLHNKEKHPFGMADLQAALELVQKLDPPGVGARDLRECLLIQMRQSPEDLSFEIELVSKYWTELLENNLPQIAKKMNCSVERINEAIERLSKLDTSPGLGVGRNENYPINADVIVEPDDRGGYEVRLADSFVPALRINSFYKKMARNRSIDDQTRDFLLKNIRSAQWFMDAVEQRKNTLLKVARAIVRHQHDFFTHGKLYLKPLPMAAIAEEVGVHIATVSRAVAGKYVQCPQGILPLRSFFSGGLEDPSGHQHSYDAIKAKLEEIVNNEDKTNPLSDEEIRKKLAEAGMGNIARRTVAKYRKLLNIPTAKFRRKY